jgi:DNA polymerase I
MKFRRLTDKQEAESLIWFHNGKNLPIAVDLETTGLNPRADRILDVVMTGGQDDESVSFSGDFASLLSHLTCPLVFHNYKFDVQMLLAAGVDLRGRHIRDTMLMHHLIDEEAPHSLDSIVKAEFGDNYKEVFWSKYDRYEDAPEEARLEYACKDAIYTLSLYRRFTGVLRDRGIPDSLVEHVHRLAASLLGTEIRGIAVDLPYLMERGTFLQKAIQDLKPQMRAACSVQITACEMDMWAKEIDKFKTEKKRQSVQKPEFSFDSSTQLKELLYSRLRLPVQYDQKTRKPTTGDDALVALADAHSLIPLLREYRGHQKVYGSYIEGTLDRMVDGRIHPEFNINGTKTGRISHSNPNMGQLPASGGIRGIYISDRGHCLISADYAQLEVVLAAHFSQDANLLKVVLEGASLHDITAEALGIPRPLAKTLNFALQYGAGEWKVAQVLSCSPAEAKHALDKYWEAYSGLKRLIDECHAKVDRGEPIINPFGRQRHFPTTFESQRDKNRAYRQSFNALIQGTGGDLTSKAFYNIDRDLKDMKAGYGLFTVHDEILISSGTREARYAEEMLVKFMVLAGEYIGLSVPLTAQASGPMERWED